MVALTLATTFPSVVGGHSSYNSSGLPPEKLAEEMFSYANHQLLESVFFPGNTLSPSYVQVTYSFKNSCTPQPDLCDENNKDDIWLWSYSPVYLVFHPESLNALALTIIGPKLLPSKVKGSVTKTVFNSIRGGGRMCLCLDEKYENIKHDVEKLRNLTAMVRTWNDLNMHVDLMAIHAVIYNPALVFYLCVGEGGGTDPGHPWFPSQMK